MARRTFLLVAAGVLLGLPAPAAEKRKRPAYWPGSVADRMEMHELLAKYRKEELVLKCRVEDENAHLGTYVVGDELPVEVVVGPKKNRQFGSAKHGRDGGDLLIRTYWMDKGFRKTLGEGMKTITAGC